MVGKVISRVLFLAIACSLSAGCAAPTMSYRCGELTRGPSVDARSLWQCHRDIMSRVVDGKKFTLREYSRAARFFEEVTGIPTDARPRYPGMVPGPDLARDIEKWDGWFAEFGDRLRWDAEGGRVTISPE